MSDEADGTTSSGVAVDDSTRRPVGERRRWLTVARKDVADAGRAWQLYALGGVFTTVVAIGGLGPFLMSTVQPNRPLDVADVYVSLASLTELVVPLVVLLFGHAAITGERERGGLRTLLALPLSRHDVLLGTLLGQTAVVVSTLSVGLLLVGVPMAWVYDGFALVRYVGLAASILGFAACFVAVAVGVSAAVRSRGRALGAAVAVYAVTTPFWRLLLGLVRAATGVSPLRYLQAPDVAPAWYVFVQRARPGTAWRNVVTEWVVPVLPDTHVGARSTEPRLTTQGPEPFFLDAWFLALVVLAWALVPLAVGYWRFRDAEVA